jgi:hypothetical protein
MEALTKLMRATPLKLLNHNEKMPGKSDNIDHLNPEQIDHPTLLIFKGF